MTPLSALAMCDPETAKAKILAALKAADGNRPKAAEDLGITLRTLYRIMGRLEINGALAPEVNPNAVALSSEDAKAAMEEHGNLRAAAEALGVSPSTVWNRIQDLS